MSVSNKRFSLADLIYVYPFKDADDRSKRNVWLKGRIIPGYDSDVFRQDACGAIMQYSEHGNTQSILGWEIDHIKPRAKGGQTTIDNVQPLNWKNNRRKGDTYPWSCN
jgi:5-methylcytosine-specific restriction endonuclease McrA